MRPRTGHLADEECADLARGRGDARRERHLEGCARCARRLRLWRDVKGFAGREAAYAPPDSLVREVRGRFAYQKPAGMLERAARAAVLLFDSMSAPLAEGVRSAAAPSRLLLYGKGGRLLKLRVETQDQSESLSLTGQVVEEGDPKRKLGNLPVLVQSGGRTVDQTLTNQSGEFELELKPASAMRLTVGVPGPGALIVILPVVVAVEEDS